MSGPKDYELTYEAARLAQRRAALEKQQRQRAKQTRDRLAKQRRAAQQRIASLQSERGAATRASLEQQSQEAQRRAEAASRATVPSRTPEIPAIAIDENVERLLGKARDELASLMEIVGEAAHTPAIAEFADELRSLTGDHAPTAASRIEGLRKKIEAAHADAQVREEQLNQHLESLVAWQNVLADDGNVQQFCGDDSAAWQQSAESLLREHSEGIGLDVALSRTAKMVEEAQGVHVKAGDCKSKFDERNELLKDVISSLKEIGFFVEDPVFEDAGKPGGPVIVKASRGDEKVITRLDLSNKVQSVWDGLADEHCKDGFFAYVDKMKARGLGVKASRPDLQQRPILKRKGAIDLPQNKTGDVRS